MLDLKTLRENPQDIEKRLQTKVPEAELGPILLLDEEVRSLKSKVEELQSKRNRLSKEIGMKKSKGEDCNDLMHEVTSMADLTSDINGKLKGFEEKLKDLLARLPNPPMSDVKISMDPADNEFVRGDGNKPSFNFNALNHVEINELHDLFDFAGGAKITGTGWPIYRGDGARLEWALLSFMLDFHRKKGFEQIMPPLLVKEEMMYGSGQLPKFADQSYKLTDGAYPFYLVPTSEVALNGMHSGDIIDEDDLPLRYAAYTPCFRREAGAAGSNERGIIRIHQFNKVEMFCFSKPEESEEIFDEMVSSAEGILKELGLHYRSMKLVTGDMSFSGAKTIDVEVWLPGQDRYYEVSSVSNCTDFQARRSSIRCRKRGEKPRFAHTLNGSGLATSRLMVALLENNQREDGTIVLPKVLSPYLGGMTELKPKRPKKQL